MNNHSTPNLEDFLQHIKKQHQQKQIQQHNQPLPNPTTDQTSPETSLKNSPDPLEVIKAKHQQKLQSSPPQAVTNEVFQQLKQQQIQPTFSPDRLQANLEDIRRSEQHRQQQKKQAIAQAQTWLKQLNPYSDEGLWFEQFAASYSSRLEAAIDYLNALQKSH